MLMSPNVNFHFQSSVSGSPTTVASGPGGSPTGDSGTPGTSSATHGVPEISMSLPVLSQVDRSNSILKDVLNPKP